MNKKTAAMPTSPNTLEIRPSSSSQHYTHIFPSARTQNNHRHIHPQNPYNLKNKNTTPIPTRPTVLEIRPSPASQHYTHISPSAGTQNNHHLHSRNPHNLTNNTTTIPTTPEIWPSPFPSCVQGTSASLSSPNIITIPTPSSPPMPNSSSPSSSSGFKTQRGISNSSNPLAGGPLFMQMTGINTRKSFGELAREIQKTVRPPRERSRGRGDMGGRGVEKKERGNDVLLPRLRSGAGRGRTYSGVAKKVPQKKAEKKVQKGKERIEVDVEAGLERRICSVQGVSMGGTACKCDGWKLVRREGAGAGSAGLPGTKMALCDHFVELLKKMYAEEDE